MLADRSISIQQGRLDPEIHLPSESKWELLEFIREELPTWRDHPSRPNNTAETRLTEHLCNHLNSAVYRTDEWSHVQFQTESGDETKGGRTIDLVAKPRAAIIHIGGRRHTQFDSLFPIECKRLPTPKKSGRDEREYVLTTNGTTGGVQRFKFGYHGAAHNFGALIGYIQEEDAAFWASKVNDWIDGLIETGSEWSESERLELQNECSGSVTCSLKSIHSRCDGLEPIELGHLWIGMN